MSLLLDETRSGFVKRRTCTCIIGFTKKKNTPQKTKQTESKSVLSNVFFFRIIFGRMASICSPVKYIWFKYVHVAKKTYSMTFVDRHKTHYFILKWSLFCILLLKKFKMLTFTTNIKRKMWDLSKPYCPQYELTVGVILGWRSVNTRKRVTGVLISLFSK